MYGEVHANHVYYKDRPDPGHKFRQIALHELDKFIMTIHEGDVIRTAPDFRAESTDSEAYFFNSLREATAEVEKECKRAEQEGWKPYRGTLP